MISEPEAQELHELIGAAIEAGDTSGLIRARELASLVLSDATDPAQAAPIYQEIILIAPIPGRAYDEPEAIGPFPEGFAADHLKNLLTVGADYEATVIALKNAGERWDED